MTGSRRGLWTGCLNGQLTVIKSLTSNKFKVSSIDRKSTHIDHTLHYRVCRTKSEKVLGFHETLVP